MKGTVHYEVRDNVTLLTIEYPLVNPLSSGVRKGLHDGLVKALADDTLDAIIKGGPMFWADRQGLDHVLANIKAFKETCGGEIWEPAPLLARLVAEGKDFSSLQGSWCPVP